MMFSNLQDLEKNTTLFPRSQELFMGGSKIQVYQTLRQASLSMGISTPLISLIEVHLQQNQFLKKFADNQIPGVLKRDYSKKGAHVFIPGQVDVKKKVKEAIQEEEETWKRVENFFGRPKWFVQPFVPQLRKVGEVRAYILEGIICYKMTTTPAGSGTSDEMSISDEQPLRTLPSHL
jgi:hypothetical protein